MTGWIKEKERKWGQLETAVNMTVEEIKRLKSALKIAEDAHEITINDYLDVLDENKQLKRKINEMQVLNK